MEPVKVAAVQAAPGLMDRDETIGKVVALSERAAAKGARLVAFPEAFVPGYPDWVWRTRPWDADATAPAVIETPGPFSPQAMATGPDVGPGYEGE
jgi:predicted amidohydrolase